MLKQMSDQVRHFHETHPICDMLGLNLTHPRFVLDHIDLGKRQETTCRGDFVKFREWGMDLVMCKGGPVLYDENFAAVWTREPEHRPGRENPDRMYLSSAFKNPTQVTLSILDRFLCDVEANPDKVALIRTGADIDRTKAAGKVGVLMGSNRSDWFGDAPGVLRMFARLGLRMITLSVSGRDFGYDGHDELRSGGRLTDLGVHMVREMNQCGILIDLAHTNDVCALDIIEVSEKPVLDTHSRPRALEGDTRNISDEVMKALSAGGGVLGLFPPISRPDGETPYEDVSTTELDSFFTALEYTVDVMGVEGIGIGTHFNTACMPWLTDGLIRAGYSDDDIASVMGGNYMRVLRQVLPADDTDRDR